MLAQKRTPAQEGKAFQVNLKRLLDELGVWSEFAQLLAAGCNVNTITAALAVLGSDRTADSWETLTGFRRRQLGTVLSRMTECAGDIEKLNASGIAQLLLRETSATGSSDITACLLALPKVLRIYADFFKSLARERKLQPKTKAHMDHARAILAQHVIEATGQPHDPEVARLLSVMLNRPNLTADSQKDWRREHRELLRTVALFATSPTTHRP